MNSEQIPLEAAGALIYNAAAATTHVDSGLAVVPTPIPAATSSTLGGSIDMDMVDDTSGEDLSSYFNELAQSFEQGIDVGSFDWNSLFSDFDSTIT